MDSQKSSSDQLFLTHLHWDEDMYPLAVFARSRNNFPGKNFDIGKVREYAYFYRDGEDYLVERASHADSQGIVELANSSLLWRRFVNVSVDHYVPAAGEHLRRLLVQYEQLNKTSKYPTLVSDNAIEFVDNHAPSILDTSRYYVWDYDTASDGTIMTAHIVEGNLDSGVSVEGKLTSTLSKMFGQYNISRVDAQIINSGVNECDLGGLISDQTVASVYASQNNLANLVFLPSEVGFLLDRINEFVPKSHKQKKRSERTPFELPLSLEYQFMDMLENPVLENIETDDTFYE